MNVRIIPRPLHGVIQAPPSKSMAHRLLVCGGLAKSGASILHGISDSEDMMATLGCLAALGVQYKKAGNTVTITGTDLFSAEPKEPLACRESGSTLRFFLPLALMCGKEVRFSGSAKLLSRPLTVYETICCEQNLFYRQTETEVSVRGRLTPGHYKIPGNISSQFISGLLFALPLCEGDSTLSILPPVESRPYLELTIEALAAFGVHVSWTDDRTLFVPGRQIYHPCEMTVEGDYSNAAFFAALKLFGNEVEITGLSDASRQGDKVYLKFFEMLAKGTPTIHIGDCPDLGPILMAVAAAKNGAVFRETRRLKIKESDRGAAMAQELAKFGASVTVHEDSIVVYPASFHAPREILHGHNDHRIVMALSALLTVTGGEIEGAQAVRKSLPEYFDMLKSLGAEVIEYEA